MSHCSSIDIDTAALAEVDTALKFEPFKLNEISTIRALLAGAPSRTCDFTIGGLYMWTDYFLYTRAIVNGDTLFIHGADERDVNRSAYSLPVGRMPLRRSIALLREYCAAHDEPLRLSAVPAEAVESLQAMGGHVESELVDWADYLYDAAQLATLSGKKMQKKRNHVNAFASANPGYTLTPLTPANVAPVIDFYRSMTLPTDKGITAEVERMQTLNVLEHLEQYPFEGLVLATEADGIVAFTLGEVKDDTLYVHIEKMRHDINGAGETINKLFARTMVERHGVAYINREEDTGDPGLRAAKESYHPAKLLRKYDIVFD